MTRAEAIQAAEAKALADHRGGFRGVPLSTLESIQRYGIAGMPPGDFVTACLCGNLVDAYGRADDDNIAAMQEIARYIYNELRAPFRTPDLMRQWMQAKCVEFREQEPEEGDGA